MSFKNENLRDKFFMLSSTSRAKAEGLSSTQSNNRLQQEINSITAKAKKNYNKLETDAQAGRKMIKSNKNQLEQFEKSLGNEKNRVYKKMHKNIENAKERYKQRKILLPDPEISITRPILPNVISNNRRIFLPEISSINNTITRPILSNVKLINNRRNVSNVNNRRPEELSEEFKWESILPNTSSSNSRIKGLFEKYKIAQNKKERNEVLKDSKVVLNKIIQNVIKKL